MFWEKTRLKYEICVPPIQKPFCELTHEETEGFFQWQLSHLYGRIDYLCSVVVHQTTISRKKLDLSPESLVLIWEWFLKVAETERTPAEKLAELEKQYSSYSEAFRNYLLNTSKEQFSLETEFILRDIGMYFGEVFVKNISGLKWSYYEQPKTDFFVNMPVVSGFIDTRFHPPFKMFFEPVHMARVQAARIWDNRQTKNDLVNVFFNWASKAPNNSDAVRE